MKNDIEKKEIQNIKILFVIVKATSDIISSINNDPRSEEMSKSAKDIIEYIESDGATKKEALKRITDHVEKMRDVFSLPMNDPIQFDQGGFISDGKENIRICEGETVLSKKGLAIGYPCQDIPPLGKVECPESIDNKAKLFDPYTFDPDPNKTDDPSLDGLFALVKNNNNESI